MITVIRQLMAQAYLANSDVISRKLPENCRDTTKIKVFMSMYEMDMYNLDACRFCFHNKLFLQRYQIKYIWYIFAIQ